MLREKNPFRKSGFRGTKCPLQSKETKGQNVPLKPKYPDPAGRLAEERLAAVGETVLPPYERLVLDDVGKSRPTPFSLERLYALFEGASAGRHDLILTSNLPPRPTPGGSETWARRCCRGSWAGWWCRWKDPT